MQAIILAGGFGTRLSHVVPGVPKPMAPVAGRPFLAWFVDMLIEHGVSEVMLSVHHLKEQIIDFFGDSYQGIPIQYAVEEKALGTGGGIRFAMRQLAPSKPVLALNGDSIVMLDHQKLYKQHLQSVSKATLALREVADCSRYGRVMVDQKHITSFNAKGESGPGHINAGVYVLNPDVFDAYNLPQSFSIEHDLFGAHTESLKLGYYTGCDYFIDIGVPEDYHRAQTELPEVLKSCHPREGGDPCQAKRVM